MSEESKELQPVLVDQESISSLIYEVRGVKVMLDADLARIYGYETKLFNRQVKRNIEKFEGEDFMFQLTSDEVEILRCQNDTSKLGRSTPANRLLLTGELTLPGKIILEAEAGGVIFLYVGAPAPL